MFVLEAVPLVAGAAIGWGMHRLRLGRRARIVALLLVSVVLGFGISVLAGEFELSPAYVVWDTAQVAVGAALALAVLARRDARALPLSD
jgi:hypothetical protein